MHAAFASLDEAVGFVAVAGDRLREWLARIVLPRLGHSASADIWTASLPQGDSWMDLAHFLRTVGKPAEAEHAAREALALFERKGNRPSSDATRAFIAEPGSSG